MLSLPLPVHQALLELAGEADLLLLGEMHGTQEVPLLITSLLADLAALGYGALALELPSSERSAIEDWATGTTATVPPFFLRPALDGRESEQMLALTKAAADAGWPILCFDNDREDNCPDWYARERVMAKHLGEQWLQKCSAARVVGICGNMHSRIVLPTTLSPHLWPSFAACVQANHAERIVLSFCVVFHGGSNFNQGLQDARDYSAGEPISTAEVREDVHYSHSLALHLPHATPATFLTPPLPAE